MFTYCMLDKTYLTSSSALVSLVNAQFGQTVLVHVQYTQGVLCEPLSCLLHAWKRLENSLGGLQPGARFGKKSIFKKKKYL